MTELWYALLMEQSLQHTLAQAGIEAQPVSTSNLSQLGPCKGAYVLLLRLADPVAVTLPKRPQTSLGAGKYLYVGSANGPGGMAARLKRHMSKTKKLHWHVDQLTTKAAEITALAVEGGNECMLGAALLNSGQYQTILPGFGSSDCRQCNSHLLMPAMTG